MAWQPERWIGLYFRCSCSGQPSTLDSITQLQQSARSPKTDSGNRTPTKMYWWKSFVVCREHKHKSSDTGSQWLLRTAHDVYPHFILCGSETIKCKKVIVHI